jgi:hypothetical protein
MSVNGIYVKKCDNRDWIKVNLSEKIEIKINDQIGLTWDRIKNDAKIKYLFSYLIQTTLDKP